MEKNLQINYMLASYIEKSTNKSAIKYIASLIALTCKVKHISGYLITRAHENYFVVHFNF